MIAPYKKPKPVSIKNPVSAAPPAPMPAIPRECPTQVLHEGHEKRPLSELDVAYLAKVLIMDMMAGLLNHHNDVDRRTRL